MLLCLLQTNVLVDIIKYPRYLIMILHVPTQSSPFAFDVESDPRRKKKHTQSKIDVIDVT